ncbi:MAG TPA: ABC transporter permease [Chloroflexota bacterium]|jgi:peptide/nickel transport system permease protein
MSAYFFKRSLGVIPVMLLVSAVVYGLLHLAPGDPASLLLPEDATEVDRAAMRANWGLDQPVYVQYFYFVRNAVEGDLGRSFRFAQPVADLIAQRLPATVELDFFAMAIACLVAIPLGVFAGAKPNSAVDNAGTTFGLFGISMPNFWFGIMLILLFAGVFHIFPSSGRSEYGVAGPTITGFYFLDSLIEGNWAALADAFRHVVLPALTLGSGVAGILMRITRSAVLEANHNDFVVVARAKGVIDRTVLRRHVFRNALIPIVTVVGLEMGTLLSVSIITETVFAWPGTGSLLIIGVSSRDYPLVTGIVLVYSVAFVLINLAVDAVYALADPRVRY